MPVVTTSSQGATGEWIVDGRMSVVDGRQCAKNPAAGVSSIPLATLHGTRGLIAGMSFHLQPAGSFLDGQTGRGIKGQSFNLSNTISCGPRR